MGNRKRTSGEQKTKNQRNKTPKAVSPVQAEENFDLYGGEIRLFYRDSSHRYRVSEKGSKPVHVPSVTTILNVLNKPAIAEWACRVCCDYIEENLRLLIAGNSFSESEVFKIISLGRNAHDRAREEAAGIGTSAHDYLSRYWLSVIHKKPLPVLPDEGRIRNCVDAALAWFKERHIEPISVESPQYSRTYHICGRPDLIAFVDGELSVVDYKSTKALWPECPIQMTPYAKMHEEMNGVLPKVRWGLRMDKETGEFDDRRYPPEQFDLDWDSFMCCRTIYERMKHLRRKEKPESKQDYLAEL
jgi:PD-(D/E)XK nuclease superfamily protein